MGRYRRRATDDTQAPWLLNCGKRCHPPCLHCSLLVGAEGAAGAGVTATSTGSTPAATIAGDLGDKRPVAGSTVYCDTPEAGALT
jgi:hypothetical protein